MIALVTATAVATACGRPVAAVPVALPAPVVARTACGSFEVGTDGTVSRHPSTSAPAWAPEAVSQPAPGVWVAHPGSRLAIYRGGRLVWLSRIRHASDDVVVRGSHIAFTVYGHDPSASPQLWLAHVGGREVRVGVHEEPVSWTPGGLVTVHDGVVRARGADGVVYRTLGLGRSVVAEPDTDTVLFLSRRGSLLRTDGRRVWKVAGGFGSGAWVQRLAGGVLDVSNGRRSVFLRSDGSRLGIAAPVDQAAGAMRAVVALPEGRGVVYVVNRARHGGNAGLNVVYLARAHVRARRLYARRVPRLSCGESTSLSYFAGRLLYVDDEGPVAVLDPEGKPLGLTRAFRRLQPRRASMWQLSADWAAKWR